MRSQGRLPDFVIIGAMKCGTTTLFRWLDEHPGTGLPGVKEPHYFSHPDATPGGLDGYRRLFAGCPPARTTGEASPVYVDPAVAEGAAERMVAAVPDARLIMLTRDRAERTLSHYHHAVRTAREERPFAQAATPDSEYVRRSLYAEGLRPYLRRFAAPQLLVSSLEALTTDGGQRVWEAVLDHLRLAAAARPQSHHNAGNRLETVPGWLLRLAASQRFLLGKLPPEGRDAARRIAARFGSRNPLLDAGVVELPASSVQRLRADEEAVEQLLDAHAVRVVD